MDKDLALAFEFDKAPEVVKKSAEAYRNAWLASTKADAQVKLWTEKASEEKKLFIEAQKKFRQAVEAWDPAETLKKNPVEIVKK